MLGKLNNDECMTLLNNNNVGRIGCSHRKKTYIIPVTYAFDNNSIIVHSRMGEKIEVMRRNPGVCFEVDEIDQLNKWKSVVIHGEYREITDQQERNNLMQLFIKKVLKININADTIKLKGKSLHPENPSDQNSIVFRISIDTINGRFETPDSNRIFHWFN